MRKSALTLVLIAGLVLSACGKPVNEGVVIDKNFEPAHSETRTVSETYYMPEYRCRMVTKTQYVNGKSQTVSSNECGTENVAHTRWVPRTFYYDDEWTIKIRHCTTDGNEEKCRVGTKEVSRNLYNRAELGSYFKDGELTAKGDF